jgi:Protein of unknown function (DUF3788)
MTANGERPAQPTTDELAELLGAGYALWCDLGTAARKAHAPVTERWVYGGRKYGWSCRLERGKQGILYMTPDAGHFRVGLALTDAARDEILAGELPIGIREALAAANKAIEGWPVRMPVRTAEDVAVVLKLAEIKLAAR